MNALAASTGVPVDQALRNQTRWRSMVPWGNSLRVELTREAAETAALLGSQKQNLIREFSKASQELAGAGAGALGYGGLFGKATAFAASPLGAATIGVAAITGMVAHAEREHDQLAREVRTYSLRYGSSSESASRLFGSGIDETAIARVQRSFSEKSESQMRGFASIGLDPDKLAAMPVERALTQINAAFEKIPNAADRAYVAFELFGKGGYQTIDTLQRMKEKIDLLGESEIIHPEDIERVKAYDKAWSQAADAVRDVNLAIGEFVGTKSGLLTHFLRQVEMAPIMFREIELELTGRSGGKEYAELRRREDKIKDRWRREDDAIAHANRRAMEKAGVSPAEARDLEKDYRSGNLTKNEYDKAASEKIDALQTNTHRLEDQAENRKNAMEKLERLENQLYGMEEGSAAEKRKKFIDELREAGVRGGENLFGTFGDAGNMIDRYDAAVLQNEGRKEFENQQRELDRERQREQDEAVRAEEERFRRERETKKRLHSPEQIARDELREMNEFRDSLTDAEYARGRRGIAEKLMGAMGGGEIRTVGMMTAGSAELHSLVAKANMPDPKIAMMQQALALLQSIERELQAERGETLQ
jgi:hypothetical protein